MNFVPPCPPSRRPALLETIHGFISVVFDKAKGEALITANPAVGTLKTFEGRSPISRREKPVISASQRKGFAGLWDHFS